MTTFVTAFYNLEKYSQIKLYKKELKEYFGHLDFLMSVPGKLIIFTEDEYLKIVEDAKNKYRKNLETEIILKKWEDLYWVQYFPVINSLCKFNGRNSHDDSPEFIPIMWEKILFVNEIIDKDEKYFSWIDFGLGRIPHYGNYKNAFNIKKEKIRFMVSNIDIFNENHYYNDAGTSLCAGGYITGSGKYFKLLKEIFVKEAHNCLTNLKCCPREETILVNLLEKNKNIFDIYYGDNNSCMLTNYDGYYYCIENTSNNLIKISNFHERTVNLCEKILEAFNENKTNINVEFLFQVLDTLIISLYYSGKVEKGIKYINTFKSYLIFTDFRNIYEKNKNRLDANFGFFN